MSNDILIEGKFSLEGDPKEFMEKFKQLCENNNIAFNGRITITEFTDYKDVTEDV